MTRRATRPDTGIVMTKVRPWGDGRYRWTVHHFGDAGRYLRLGHGTEDTADQAWAAAADVVRHGNATRRAA